MDFKMSGFGHAGSRIRDRRIEQGLKQGDLAKLAGISASYLNLIEHNRRRIAGKLLGEIAQHLNTTPDALAQGVDAALLGQLRNAADDQGLQVEIEKVSEFAGRYAGWAELVVRQSDQLRAFQSQVSVLNDRLTYDPSLAHSLHDVISAVTSIRSSASILVNGEKLDADWQARFHRNVYDDAIRLTQSSEALIRYLEAPTTQTSDHLPPEQDVEAWLQETGYHVAKLESGEATVSQIVGSANLSSELARNILSNHLRDYVAQAKALPYAAFEDRAIALKYDPLRLSQHFAVGVPLVMRRLATLRAGQRHPEIGLVECDASGTIVQRKAISGFSMPRSGAACPIWPLFSAFSRPDQPVRSVVEIPGRDHEQFLCYAFATGSGVAHFDAPPVMRSTMIAISDPPLGGGDPLLAGISCSICPRQKCASRREASIIVGAQGL